MSFLATISVFFRSIATVIGPTPPGTGVMKPAFFFTSKRKERKELTKNVSRKFFLIHFSRKVQLATSLKDRDLDNTEEYVKKLQQKSSNPQ